MAKVDLWMPLYVADFMADTSHLDAAEVGAYISLIMAYWRSGGPLKANERALQNISRMTAEQWAQSRETLLAFFTEVDGLLTHKRIDQEIDRAKELAKAQSEKAKAAANKRWECSKHAPSNAPSMPQAMPEQCLTNAPTPTPTPIQVSKKVYAPSKDAAKPARGSRLPDDWQPSNDLVNFALAERPSIDLRTEIEKFRDYWHSKPGSAACKLDWSKTFKNWIRNAKDAKPNGNSFNALASQQRTTAELADSPRLGYGQPEHGRGGDSGQHGIIIARLPGGMLLTGEPEGRGAAVSVLPELRGIRTISGNLGQGGEGDGTPQVSRAGKATG